MKVTPVKKSFGSHKLGDVFELNDRPAKLLIRVGRLAHAPVKPDGQETSRVATPTVENMEASQAYGTRMLTSNVQNEVPGAPAKRSYTRRNMRAQD